jgi:ATP-dependent Clp protease adaptor protein ClpS
MSDDIDVLKPDTVLKPKIEQPQLYKVVRINDDYTQREFVVQVLMAVFRTTEDQCYRIMMTGHQRGACVFNGQEASVESICRAASVVP